MATTPITTQPATPAPEVKEWRYQPVYPDDYDGVFPEGHAQAGQPMAGQPMGGEQVIKYDGTAEDLGKKMAENNGRLQLELRNMKRQAMISATETQEEEIPADAERASQFHALQPRRLTPEERLRVSRSLADPEKLEEGADLLFEARYGATPAQLKRLDDLTTKNYFAMQGQEFRRRHPDLDWRVTEAPRQIIETVTENGQVIRKNKGMTTGCVTVDLLLAWCDKRDLACTVNNLERALQRLKVAGLLPDAPIATEETTGEIASGTVTGERLADSSQQPTASRERPAVRTSALTNRNSSLPAPVVKADPTWAEIEARTPEQLRGMQPAWRAKAIMLFRKLPAPELNKKLALKKWADKLDALG